MINILCDTALGYGFSEEREQVDADLVRAVLADQAATAFNNLQLIESPNTTTGQNAIYDLVVTNCGQNAASNVVLRDFYPSTTSGPVRLGNGVWTCADSSCSGAGFVNAQLGTLAPAGSPGSSATVRVQRGLFSGIV